MPKNQYSPVKGINHSNTLPKKMCPNTECLINRKNESIRLASNMLILFIPEDIPYDRGLLRIERTCKSHEIRISTDKYEMNDIFYCVIYFSLRYANWSVIHLDNNLFVIAHLFPRVFHMIHGTHSPFIHINIINDHMLNQIRNKIQNSNKTV